jgi:RNA recognition motif-containing protein
MSTKLYVGNLPFQMTQQELESLLGQLGQVESVNIITDRETGQPRGFAFVEMATSEDAQAAIRALDGKDIAGRALKVNEARAKEDRGGRRPGGGGGGRGGFGGGGRGGFGGGGGRGNRY